jgi:hypothetical protein
VKFYHYSDEEKIFFCFNYFCFFLFVSCRDSQKLTPGYPDRFGGLDVLPGFKEPPPGYGEVPFWWWTGDTLNTDRLTAQVRELHKKGISGVQVNYSHYDTPGWLTENDDPLLFSDKWWDVYSCISEVCAELDMGIGLSTYTLDWPRGASNLFYHLFYSNPGLNAIQLERGERWRISTGELLKKKVSEDVFAVHAYSVRSGTPECGGIDLTSKIKNGIFSWYAPDGEWGGMTFKGNKIYIHILNWPEDGSPLVLPALDKKIISSKGFNVKNPVVKQTSSGLEINLAPEKRDQVDSIILLEID